MAVYGGNSSFDMSKYILSDSSTSRCGIISFAAGQLLESLPTTTSSDGKKTKVGSVTFSWYTLDPSKDIITDVLRTASSPPPPPPSSSSNSSSSIGHPDLILREVGKGKGMFVPGLWEVEVASGSDIEAVISHVSKLLPDSDHSKGTFHTVLQLTVSPTAKNNNKKAAVTNNDKPQGRLSILLLSNVFTSTTPSPNSRVTYPWVDQISNISQWLISKRASPPFHKSRLLLLIRDILCKRFPATLTLMITPNSEDDITAINQWLKVFGDLNSCASAASVPVLTASLSSNSNHKAISNENTPKPTPSSAIRFKSSVENNLAESVRNSKSNAENPLSGLNESLSELINTEPKIESPLKELNFTLNSNIQSHVKSNIHSHVHTNTFNDRDTELALATALEASRDEARQLKTLLSNSTARLESCQAAYDGLVSQLKEEGSMLMKKDQERYRKALRDLRDYEIYKEVMEAAMVKLQAELDNLSNENKSLQSNCFAAEEKARKVISTSIKTSKEGLEASKKLSNLESTLVDNNKLIKKLTKERDIAVAAVSQIRIEFGKKDKANKSDMESLSKELADSKSKIKTLSDANALLEKEKTIQSLSSNKELTDLRAAHTKALEMLMEYQEENGNYF